MGYTQPFLVLAALVLIAVGLYYMIVNTTNSEPTLILNGIVNPMMTTRCASYTGSSSSYTIRGWINVETISKNVTCDILTMVGDPAFSEKYQRSAPLLSVPCMSHPITSDNIIYKLSLMSDDTGAVHLTTLYSGNTAPKPLKIAPNTSVTKYTKPNLKELSTTSIKSAPTGTTATVIEVHNFDSTNQVAAVSMPLDTKKWVFLASVVDVTKDGTTVKISIDGSQWSGVFYPSDSFKPASITTLIVGDFANNNTCKTVSYNLTHLRLDDAVIPDKILSYEYSVTCLDCDEIVKKVTSCEADSVDTQVVETTLTSIIKTEPSQTPSDKTTQTVGGVKSTLT